LCFRPVYAIAIRTPEFFRNVDPLWFPYFMTDLRRVAKSWHEGEHLAELDEVAQAESARLEESIEANPAAGHWGVPTCAFEGEPFFGQDRLDVLMWRLRQSGLQRRRA